MRLVMAQVELACKTGVVEQPTCVAENSASHVEFFSSHVGRQCSL